MSFQTEVMMADRMRWAVRTAESVMERTPRLYEAKGYEGKWSYDYGVILKGFELLWRQTGHPEYFRYIREQMDYFIGEDGSIRGYRPDEYNIDHLNNGKLLFALYRETGLDKYRLAAGQLREQLKQHPRTSELAFWHKQIYPQQIWLDGLYMGAPFYLEYLLAFEAGQGLEDVTRQFIICERHTKDPQTGLLYHAWDEQRAQPWSHPQTGQSPNFWGRSLGWYVMALADVLAILPAGHEDYAELVRILQDTLGALRRFQDPSSGVWYQVVNESGRKGNYLESSASGMITYAIAKGIMLGVLEAEAGWQETLDRAYAGLIAEFVTVTGRGWVNLNKTCQVAGLGGEDRRDGTYAYYISEPIITNDQKGLGAFLLACGEYEQLQRSRGQHTASH
ncbi:glycoside hydrolase family 88 protein [Paenibacillus sp. MMS20-IR301]|uniref:glycoside hydrolase family 88/105 protein n=1 Tax=Paenibacillus sp. MMS20-IR301 TaxID=2895946 RepID=UPI0028EA7325|nr:glycoside hydrolase family 88 protein [Paenibacillus sp. MMS20-IR301]WNS43190.1 glycoside hydrolase family 88 protein [Paenibacillus sp. MMS20-IR301]